MEKKELLKKLQLIVMQSVSSADIFSYLAQEYGEQKLFDAEKFAQKIGEISLEYFHKINDDD